jgi:hypothetical protein
VSPKRGEIVKRLPLVALLALTYLVATSSAAQAKGLTASVQGATVNGLPYRYVALAPNSPYGMNSTRPTEKFTIVGRIDKRGGRLGRWWYLPGMYSIPAAAYDDRSGGLSADGDTLVLSRFSWIYPPRTTGLAILDTDLHLRHPGVERRHAIRRVRLAGGFSFDAISPDGSTIFLIEHLSPVFGGPYRVRALDAKSGKLLPKPIVDPEEPEERMEGVPISRATSPGGRWAYTLYSGYKSQRSYADRAYEPFIHALDTVVRRAVCIDLPQLEGRQDPFLLALRTDRGGQRLAVLNRRPAQGGSHALLTVDTHSFEVDKPAPVATASSGIGPWPPIAVLGAVAALLAWIGLRHRRTAGEGPAEQA